MYPDYRFMDYYPQHISQMPCAPQYGPSFEAVPPQLKLNPTGYPIHCESWPYGGSHGYPHPVDCHTCCHYNQYPGYHGYRPPYSHFAQPPSVYSHGSYPAFPVTYPVHSIPSPYYSADNPRYEYDKHGPRDRHCCGCTNHLCQQKEDGNAKNEEQDPEDEKKFSDSLVPSQLKNLPYPIVWIPQGYMMNNEGKITDGLKSREGDKYGCDEKANGSLKSFEQEPNAWNRWLPVDLNNLGSLNQGGDGKRTQHKQNEDMSRNSFPIFWMPHKPEQVEHKEMNGDQGSFEEPEPLFLSIPPLKLIDSDDRKSQPKALEENSDTEAGLKLVRKNDVPQMIPVKLKEPSDETTLLKDVDNKDTIIPVEHKDDKPERRPVDGIAKTQSSPPKKSKLPPVCLRVDPLPRRKNNNGSSRSPSPPPNKGKSQELLNGSSKSSLSSFMQENNKEDKQSSIHLDKSKEEEQRKIKTKTIEVVDGAISKDKIEDMKDARTQTSVSLPVDCHEKFPMIETDCQAGKGDRECSFGEKIESNADDKRSGELTEDEKQIVEDSSASGKCETGVGGASNEKELKVDGLNKEIQRKKLSKAEAAVVIQSSYRGFEVRRWEPLKKLKEIAKIKEQVTEVKGRVQDLVSSYEFSSNEKQRVVIEETIMSLLLKLDTIQGFNPSVRDIRKSMAKELVSLQEKLDSLATKKSEASVERASEADLVEGISSSTSDDACTQSRQVAKDERDHKTSVGSHDLESDLAEPCGGQSLPVTDVNFSSVAVEKSEHMFSNKEACGDLEEKFSKLNVLSSVDSSYSVPFNEPKKTETSEVTNIGLAPILQPPEDYDVLKVEVDKIPLPSVAADELKSSVGLTDLSSPLDSVTGKDREMNDFQELPEGDKETDAQEISKGEVEEMNQAKQQPEELLNECPDASKHNYIVPGGAGEKDDEHFGEAILRSDLPEIAKVEDVNDTNESPEVYEVEGKVGSVEDMQVVDNGGIEMKEIAAAALEIEKKEPELSVLEDAICEDKSKESHGTSNAEDNSSEFKNINIVCKERELPMEESIQHCVDQNIEAAEEQEMLEEKPKPKEFQPMTSSTNIDDLPCENAEERVLSAEELVPPCAEQLGEKLSALPLTSGRVSHGTEMGEKLSALPPTSGHVSHDTEMGYDWKLVEENKRLKEMMEKLIEVGKEHLTAISNLSGRVKDLEKKLSGKKKLKMRRYSKSVS